ncbi:MAG: DUF4062 domain-containing protein [Candidatus Gastranaerophilaceae bacterium]
MTDKKYQIFVSSTYKDLKEERKTVIEQILNMGHLPVGMELFVASDDEQFEYIKRIINNCDYYVLILGGCYGTISKNTGISYTEMEYNYAIEKNIPILIFPYENIKKLQKTKKDEDLSNIQNFVNKVSENRLHKTWKNKDDLCLKVINSLYNAFEEKPQQGWIRPDEYDNSVLLHEINELRKCNSELEKKVSEYKKQLVPKVSDIADMDELFPLHYSYTMRESSSSYSNSLVDVTWNQLFSYIGPKLISPISAGMLQYMYDTKFINKITSKYHSKTYIDEDDANIIKVQFIAQGLINAYSSQSTKGGLSEFIQLTQKGKSYLQQIKTIKTKNK